MARRRKEFEESVFDDIYLIGEWYQKNIIQGKTYVISNIDSIL